jgi:hydroxymethylbilane synthase
MAAYAIREGKELHLRGLLANPDGSRLLRDEIRGALIEAESLGRNLAQRLLQKGGAALITEEDNIA